jgi:hypothetical protein
MIYRDGGTPITWNDIREVHTAKEWINDAVVDYVGILINRVAGPRVHVFGSYFGQNVANKQDMSGYELQVGPDSHDWIFFPTIINGNHWVLPVLDVQRSCMLYCDSLNKTSRPEWVQRISTLMARRSQRAVAFPVVNAAATAQAPGSGDCAMATVYNMCRILAGSGVQYEDAGVLTRFRKKVVLMLLYSHVHPQVARLSRHLADIARNERDQAEGTLGPRWRT